MTLPSDLALARLCAATYAAGDGSTWQRWWYGAEVWVAACELSGAQVLAFRGSRAVIDWKRDFRGLPVRHPTLGFCHRGFLEGMNEVAAELGLYLSSSRPIVLTGHSLGAARAWIAAAMLITAGLRVAKVCVFGSPRPGFEKLACTLRDSQAVLRSYRNLDDPVTRVPFFAGLYRHPVEPERLQEPPERAGDMLAEHAISLYVRGLERLENQEAVPAEVGAPS